MRPGSWMAHPGNPFSITSISSRQRNRARPRVIYLTPGTIIPFLIPRKRRKQINVKSNYCQINFYDARTPTIQSRPRTIHYFFLECKLPDKRSSRGRVPWKYLFPFYQPSLTFPSDKIRTNSDARSTAEKINSSRDRKLPRSRSLAGGETKIAVYF